MGRGWDVATFNKNLTIKGHTPQKNNNYKLSVEHVQ